MERGSDEVGIFDAHNLMLDIGFVSKTRMMNYQNSWKSIMMSTVEVEADASVNKNTNRFG